ncbi:MAG: hypothetical protein DHS20C18_16060 [Saprospiraceae bacterium]|nr:MAG: hypothetical protein DHS20C18_16060 [Saprospiraceae bacterium]
MRLKDVLLLVFVLTQINLLQAQNFLRVQDPDMWNAVNTNIPGWEESAAHAKLEEVTIIAEPQGIFTEIGLYATISQGPEAYSWQNEYEIIWQFELPGNTIVHDSWLWVGPDIIKADVVDYWTALETYEGIVNRNEDPSFFYQMPDNRYEIRIYPLPEGETRRIKMSFLVPTVWDAQTVSSGLLNNILRSTDYVPNAIGIGMPVDDLWGIPSLKFNNTLTPMTDIVVGGTGQNLYYLEVNGGALVSANVAALINNVPNSDDRTFLSTYAEGGEQFFQLAYVPDWQSILHENDPKKSLLLLDYDGQKTSLPKIEVLNRIQNTLSAHFSSSDAINIAVATTNGIHFLSDEWWDFDEGVFASALTNLAQLQDTADLALLLSEGFAWAQNQGDVTEILLMAANDVYVYPPVADEVFSTLEATIPSDVPFTLLDYQDENVSILYYNNEEYHGNEYLYQLLSEGFDVSETLIFRELNETFTQLMNQIYPAFVLPNGILDYTTTLENGVAYQRYSINSAIVTPENKGVILQTGKYLGDFPMNINANYITNEGQVLSASNTIMPEDVFVGDTLMREMWYGPHLKSLEAQSSSTDDLLYIIEESINERVLTGLTAFLALEPGEGGDPCIDCLFNNGGPVVIATEEVFDPAAAEVLVTPNPATDFAKLHLKYPEPLNPDEWQVTIFDAVGRALVKLENPVSQNGVLQWNWQIEDEISAGIYFFKMQSDFGEVIGKIVVQ